MKTPFRDRLIRASSAASRSFARCFEPLSPRPFSERQRESASESDQNCAPSRQASSLKARPSAWLLGLLLLTLPPSLSADGWEKYRLGEFDAAIKAFQAKQKDSRDERERLDALYGEAHTWMFRSSGRNPRNGEALYERFWREAPADHPLLPWSKFEVAQCRHILQPAEKRDYPSVLQGYREVYDAFPNTAAGQEAWVNAMMLEVAALRPEPLPTIALIESFLRNHPDTAWKSECYALMATLYGRNQQVPQQVEQLIRSAETQQANSISGVLDNSGLYYQIATISEFHLGDFEQARKYYRLFLKHYHRDNRAFTVQKALERMDRLEKEIREGLAKPPMIQSS